MTAQDQRQPEPGGFALAVDLGTSNTVAVVRWPDGRTRPLLFDGQPILPSGVCLDPSGRLHVGHDAQRLAQADPASYEPNPKRRVDEAAVLLGDREIGPADLLAAVLAGVARAAVEAVGFLPPAVVTYPAAWGSRRRDVLAGAVTRAGWPPVGAVGGTLLLPEPVAAARYFADVLRRPVPVGSALTVFDFGGGTLDVAVVRNDGTDEAGRAAFAVVGSGGVAELGGLDLDAALVEHLGGLLASAAPHVWEPLVRPQTPAQWRNRRQFWDDVRGAKEMLSRAATAPVPVPGMDQAVHLTREELERLIAPLLRRGVYEAARVIAAAGVRPDQLAGLFLVGGSSRVPLVARLLHADLGLAPTVLEQPELPVAEGALTALAGPAVAAAPVEATTTVAAGAGPQPAHPGPPPPYPMSPGPAPGRRPWHRRAATWVAAAVALAVLAGAGGLALYLNRGPRERAFADVSEVTRVTTGDEEPYQAFSDFYADRAYVAWQRGDRLEVAAVDADGEQRWRHTMSGRSEHWSWIRAYPGLLLVTAYASSGSQPRPMFAVDPADGRELWRRDIRGEDRIWVYDEVVVHGDDEADRLVGLDARSGAQRWSRDNPKGEYGYTDASVFSALTQADVSGPADAAGAALAPVVDDEYRLVQIGSDRTARVLDARTGKVLKERGNVGEPDGNYLAYDGRLYAAGAGSGYQIVAYDLDELGEPRSVYRAADKERGLMELDPCGADRLCLLDARGSAEDTVEVAAVDAADGGQLWRTKAAAADSLTPIGDHVLVVDSDYAKPWWSLRDGDGEQLAGRDGTAVRLDAGNALSFVGSLTSSSDNLSIAGVGARSGAVKELGPLAQAKGPTCSWNATLIVCLADANFVMWRFAAS